jgi:hypothetical protein
MPCSRAVSSCRVLVPCSRAVSWCRVLVPCPGAVSWCRSSPSGAAQTDTNPDGLTTAKGKWAETFAARLASGELTCRLLDGDEYTKAMLEKHVWICAFMMTGAARHSRLASTLASTPASNLASNLASTLASTPGMGVRLHDEAMTGAARSPTTLTLTLTLTRKLTSPAQWQAHSKAAAPRSHPMDPSSLLCPYMAGALNGGVTVGAVEAEHSAQLKALVNELCAAGGVT